MQLFEKTENTTNQSKLWPHANVKSTMSPNPNSPKIFHRSGFTAFWFWTSDWLSFELLILEPFLWASTVCILALLPVTEFRIPTSSTNNSWTCIIYPQKEMQFQKTPMWWLYVMPFDTFSCWSANARNQWKPWQQAVVKSKHSANATGQNVSNQSDYFHRSI